MIAAVAKGISAESLMGKQRHCEADVVVAVAVGGVGRFFCSENIALGAQNAFDCKS